MWGELGSLSSQACPHSAHRSQKAAVSVALSPPTAAPQLNWALGCSALSSSH